MRSTGKEQGFAGALINILNHLHYIKPSARHRLAMSQAHRLGGMEQAEKEHRKND